MNKTLAFLFTIFQLIFAIQAMAQETPSEAVQAKYGVHAGSNYADLQAALSQAIADLQNDNSDSTAYYALSAIYGWVPLAERFKLNLHVFLQPQDALFMGGVKGVKELLEAGEVPTATIKQQIADALWTKLGVLQPNSEENKALARVAVEVLILLKDARGLDAMLTDKVYIKNLQSTDEWDQESGAALFATLSQHYESLIGQSAEARELAAFYELCRLRKVAGAAVIQSTSSVIDLSQY